MTGALLVCLTVCAAPWAFGAVEPGWWSLMAVGCLVPAAAALVSRAIHGKTLQEPPAALEWLAVAFVALPLALLVPLPAGITALLSPGGAELLGSVTPPELPGWRPLTLAPHATWHAAILAGAYAAAFWVLTRAALRPERAAVLTAILVLGGGALAAFGLAQRLIAYDPQKIYWTIELSELGTPFGPYVNRNHFGGAMCLVTGLSVGLAGESFASGRRLLGAAGAAVALLAIVALLATASRGALLGLATGTCLVVVAGGRKARPRILLAIAVIAVLALGALLVTGRLEELTGRLFRVYGRWRNRFAVQHDAWTVFLSFPVAGTGLGTFEHVYPPFQTIRDVRHFSDAHSDWAQLLMDAGSAGVVLLAAVAIHVGRRIVAALRGAEAAPWGVLGPAAGVLAVCVHGFFEVNLHVPSNALLFTATLSLAYAAAARRTGSLGRSPAPRGEAAAPEAANP